MLPFPKLDDFSDTIVMHLWDRTGWQLIPKVNHETPPEEIKKPKRIRKINTTYQRFSKITRQVVKQLIVEHLNANGKTKKSPTCLRSYVNDLMPYKFEYIEIKSLCASIYLGKDKIWRAKPTRRPKRKLKSF